MNTRPTNRDLSETKTSVQSHTVTPETAFNVRTAAHAVIAPNGKMIAFLVGEWLPDQEKQCNRLWITETMNGDPRPLTTGSRRDSAPAWSPDSRYIAFASKIDGGKGNFHFQLYLRDLHTGSERQVCTMQNDISHVSWSPDGKRIAFCSGKGEPTPQDPLVQHTGTGNHLRLWTIRPESDLPDPITPNDLSIWHYTWSPDGHHFAVYYATGPEETDWYRGQIGLVAAQGGAIHQLSQLKRQAFALSWSPDSAQIAYVSGEWSDPDRGGGDIYLHSLQDGQVRNLTPEIKWSPTWLKWFPDGQRILCAGEDGLNTRVAILDVSTSIITTISDGFLIGERGWPHLSTTADMRQLAATHSEQHPYDIWQGDFSFGENQAASIAWHRCTRLNPIEEETLTLASTEHIRYESVDGWPIEALVTWPHHQNPATLPPLIVHVHGGPSGAWQDDWDFYRSQNLAAAGFVVLRPNIRGSMGRGVTFADAVIGDMGGKDLQDVLKGVDYLVERKLVDGNRIGIMGWSYGGFMAAWTVTQTQRFKAAIVGAGISDFHSFHAQTNIQDWDMRFLGQVNEPISPLTHSSVYREHSPITYASNITTPTLIVHGDKDACVPLNQAYAFYRSLQEQHVPVELVTYPREGHGLSERKHNLDYMQRTLDWFKQYV